MIHLYQIYMIVNHDIRGMQAHAKLTLISSGKNALAKRISNPKPIQEQAKTPFTGFNHRYART